MSILSGKIYSHHIRDVQSTILKEFGSEKIDVKINDLEKKKGLLYYSLVSSNYSRIKEIDEKRKGKYFWDFVRINDFLRRKEKNLQRIFFILGEIGPINPTDLKTILKIFKNEVYTYDVLFFNSISILISYVEDEQNIFNKIYSAFDRLNIFVTHSITMNKTWEIELNNKLNEIDLDLPKKNIHPILIDLLITLNENNLKILSEISKLDFTQEREFQNLKFKIFEQLNDNNSFIRIRDLMSSIQKYNLYKI